MCHRTIYLSEKLLRLCKGVAAVRLYNSTLEPLQLYEETFWQTRFLSSFNYMTGFNEANHWCLNAKSHNRLFLPFFYCLRCSEASIKNALNSSNNLLYLLCYLCTAHAIQTIRGLKLKTTPRIKDVVLVNILDETKCTSKLERIFYRQIKF